MLQKQTVSSELLELLKYISKSKIFKNFVLVGGTSLALQIGHRNSIDIDMFGESIIDVEEFVEELNKFGKVEILSRSKNILILLVNSIKVDFVNYRYKLLENYFICEDIRLASKKDIAAMKLNAITGRGSRKDFIDLYFLLEEFTLDQMFYFFDEKYEEGSYFLAMKSIRHFEVADLEADPIMYSEFNWEVAKQKIIQEVNKLSY